MNPTDFLVNIGDREEKVVEKVFINKIQKTLVLPVHLGIGQIVKSFGCAR